MTLDEQVQIGEETRRLLDNPAVTAAFDELSDNLKAAWSDTSVTQTDERELLWSSLNSLRLLQAQLANQVNTGKAAKQTLLQRIGRALSRE